MRHRLLIAALLIFFCTSVSAATFNTSAGQYPNTETCSNTPILTFVDNATVTKDYLFIAECDTPADFNHGDFVTAWIEDADGSPLIPISKFVETDSGIVWVSPLADNQGQAWERIEIDPQIFDCNSTGIPYTIKVNWDGQTAEESFSVYCPTIDFEFYREDVPYWEKMRVVANVTDNKGLPMVGIPCQASVLDFSEDENFATIKQENIEVITIGGGEARFTFETGLLQDLLQGYEYTTVVNCMGGDSNFTFTIQQTSDEYINNPLYFTIIFLSDNIVAILLALIIIGVTIGILWFIIRQD